MADNLSFVSVSEGTGKTGLALAFGCIAKEEGNEVGYLKPLGRRLRSRAGKLIDEDSLFAKKTLDLEESVEDISPIMYSQTFIEQYVRGMHDVKDLRGKVKDSYDKMSEDKDLMLIEGGGGIDTGGILGLTDFDIVNMFDSEVVMVSNYDSPENLDSIVYAADKLGDNLKGVVFNGINEVDIDKVKNEASDFLESKDIPVLGVVPWKKELAGIKVDELAGELGAEEITNLSDQDKFVERFLVGAMSGESALRYLRRAKDVALVTGGDRPDIQRAALESPGVNCLVLTGGFRPPGAIIGKAEEMEVPIISVQSDTLNTVEKADQIVSKGRTRRKESIEVLKDLISTNLDLDLIFPNL